MLEIPEQILDAEIDGFEAFVMGLGLVDNPMPRNSEAHAAWTRGWQEARRCSAK